MAFQPYTRQQLQQILSQRLGDALSRLFAPLALELCCRKVAALTGDVRRCLALASNALELACAAHAHTHALPGEAMTTSPGADRFDPLEPAQWPRGIEKSVTL